MNNTNDNPNPNPAETLAQVTGAVGATRTVIGTDGEVESRTEWHRSDSVAVCDFCATEIISNGKWNGFRIAVTDWADGPTVPMLCGSCEDWPADSEVFFTYPN